MTKKLHLGKMNNQELADWFGITKKSFQNNKTNKLKILEAYADFDIIYGGVIINSIVFNEYSKSRAIVEEKAEQIWQPGEWNTVTNVSQKIYEENKVLQKTILLDTCYSYTSKWKCDNYGVSYVRNGSQGSCLTKIVKVNEDGQYVEMTPEETKIKTQLIKKYFGTDEEKEYIIMSEYRSGNISAEEAIETLATIKGYNEENIRQFKKELAEKIGTNIKATKLQKEINW